MTAEGEPNKAEVFKLLSSLKISLISQKKPKPQAFLNIFKLRISP